jgi:hypothetical protein
MKLGLVKLATAGAVLLVASVTPATSHARPRASDGRVPTPFGWADPAWIHPVASGTLVAGEPDRTQDIVQGGGPRPLDTPQPASFIAWANAVAPSGFATLSARFTVPPLPANDDGQILYAFPSFTGSGNPPILQPVLQWGVNGVGTGGPYWALSSWFLAGLTDYKVSGIAPVHVGDVIEGTIAGQDCDGGVCATWTVTTTDLNDPSAAETISVSTTQAAYVAAQGGVLEAYDVASCDDLPGGPLAFTQIQLGDALGNTVTPSWALHVGTGFPPCGYAVNNPTPGEIDIVYNVGLDAGPADAQGPDAATPDAMDSAAPALDAASEAASLADAGAALDAAAPIDASGADAPLEATASPDAAPSGSSSQGQAGCSCSTPATRVFSCWPAPFAALAVGVLRGARRWRPARGPRVSGIG